MQLDRRFDVVAMPGNVMVFCRPSDRAAIIRQLLATSRRAVYWLPASQLESGRDALDLAGYDELCAAAGLRLQERWSTWDRQPYGGDPYAVSVHRGEETITYRTDSGR